MPTGYTAAVQDGKVTTLRQFAMTCARAFGACIMMRDDPSDAEIPERFEPETEYHDTHIATANAVLAEIPMLTAEECDARAIAEFSAAEAAATEYEASRAHGRARYQQMLAQVEGWGAPADLQGLKDFMAEQLRGSIEFDCSPSSLPGPVKMSGEEWRKIALKRAADDLAYHAKGRAEEIARANGRNAWLASLRASLPAA